MRPQGLKSKRQKQKALQSEQAAAGRVRGRGSPRQGSRAPLPAVLLRCLLSCPAPCCPAPLCRALRGYVLLCTVVHRSAALCSGCAPLCVVVRGCAPLCVVVHCSAPLCVVVHRCVWLCTALCRCARFCTTVCGCALLCTPVRCSPNLSEPFWGCRAVQGLGGSGACREGQDTFKISVFDGSGLGQRL